MTASGLEKFANLEDKLHRIVELCRKLKDEKSGLKAELDELVRQVDGLKVENSKLESKISRLNEDRRLMREKVEGMLDAIATLELEAESLKK